MTWVNKVKVKILKCYPCISRKNIFDEFRWDSVFWRCHLIIGVLVFAFPFCWRRSIFISFLLSFPTLHQHVQNIGLIGNIHTKCQPKTKEDTKMMVQIKLNLKTYTVNKSGAYLHAAVVWHSGLTKENNANIESVQKSALAIILG